MNMGFELFELVKNELDPFMTKLFEGGAFGHLAHPFEELDMTFDEVKSMVDGILSGKIDAFEKIDGQQISFSWKGGRLVGARNKSQLKEFGKNSLPPEEMKKFFAQGNVPQSVANAFYVAMVDLESAISKIPNSTLTHIFQEGKRFMNTEIVAEETSNVIPYYKDYLVFHGLIEYDVNGSPIKQIDGSGKMLEDAVNEIGQANQSKFQIKGPNKIVLKNFKDIPQEKEKFLSDLKRIQGLAPDNATIEQGQEMWWKKFVLDKAKEMGYKISETALNMLAARWGKLEKATNTIPRILAQIDNDQFKKWVVDYDKTQHERQYKENMLPYEMFFLRLGAEVLSNASGYLTASPIKTVADLAKGVQRDAERIKDSKNISDLKRLQVELERLEKIGKNKVVGSEGVVFTHNGKLYKLTGVFQPVHRILSILKYRKPTDVQEPPKLPTTKKEGLSSLSMLDAPENPVETPVKTTQINEGIAGSYDSDYSKIYRKFQAEFLNDVNGRANFPKVPDDLLKNVWFTFAKYGRVDKNKILKIWNILKESSMKLVIAGIALDGKDNAFFLKKNVDFDSPIRDQFLNYTDYTFTYSYQGFIKLIKDVYAAIDPDDMLMSIDRLLNFAHDRGPIVDYLVQGGKKTLDDISSYEAKGIHLTGKLSENIIREGGNAVYTNSALENRYLDSTIKNALQIWSLGKLKYEVVGSKNKPVMNDIDVAIDAEELGKLVGASPVDKLSFWPKVESYLKSHQPKDIPDPSYKVNKGLDQIHISAPIVGQEDKFVQIDLMLGDVGWMKDALSGAVDSQYKALYRNLLLANILSHSHEPTKDPNTLKKYQINWKKGLQSVDLMTKGGKIEKGNVQSVYNNMNDVAAFLFGSGVTFNDINTFEKLFKLIESPSFRYKAKKSDIIDSFNKDLERMKLPPIQKE